MAHPLIEVSRTQSGAVGYLAVADYNKTPMLCRSGVWVGMKTTFSETVVLSFEHEPEDLLVNWSVNDTMVGNYGPPPPFPYGTPIAENPSIGWVTPLRCPESPDRIDQCTRRHRAMHRRASPLPTAHRPEPADPSRPAQVGLPARLRGQVADQPAGRVGGVHRAASSPSRTLRGGCGKRPGRPCRAMAQAHDGRGCHKGRGLDGGGWPPGPGG
jgi:hypothetical protein